MSMRLRALSVVFLSLALMWLGLRPASCVQIPFAGLPNIDITFTMSGTQSWTLTSQDATHAHYTWNGYALDYLLETSGDQKKVKFTLTPPTGQSLSVTSYNAKATLSTAGLDAVMVPGQMKLCALVGFYDTNHYWPDNVTLYNTKVPGSFQELADTQHEAPEVVITNNRGDNAFMMGWAQSGNAGSSRGAASGTNYVVDIWRQNDISFTGSSLSDCLIINTATQPWFDVERAYAQSFDAYNNRPTRPAPPSWWLDPTYDTWYCYLDNINQTQVLNVASIANSLGFPTILIDAGWDTPTGGDWSNFETGHLGDFISQISRFPDLPGAVSTMHSWGMKVMLWNAPLWQGKRSNAYINQTSSWHITTSSGLDHSMCPRYPSTEQYLHDKFAWVMSTYGIDGMWIDFVDQSPQACISTHTHRSENMETSWTKCMQAIQSGLHSVKSDAICEARCMHANLDAKSAWDRVQPGDGPYGYDVLRLANVHIRSWAYDVVFKNDPMIWPAGSTSNTVGKFMATMICNGVPCLSVDLINAPQSQKDIISAYMSFYRGHKTTLINGQFKLFGANYGIPDMALIGSTEAIVYAKNAATSAIPVPRRLNFIYILNCTDSDVLNVRVPVASGRYSVQSYNPNLTASSALTYRDANQCLSLSQTVPQGGILVIAKTVTTPTAAEPNTPVVNSPDNGVTIAGNSTTINWTGDVHTNYRVRVNTVDNPDAGIAWDSGDVTSAAFTATTGSLLSRQTLYVYVSIGNSTGWSDWSAAGRWFKTPSPTTNVPYGNAGNPWPVPGLIEAENFDDGGEGLAYHSIVGNDPAHTYRPDETVGIETCSDTTGTYDIGYIDTGEWWKYTVNVLSDGNYSFSVRAASPNTGSKFRVEVDGTDVTGALTIPNTGGWQTYSTVQSPQVPLSAGVHVIRIYVVAAGWNFNYFTVQGSGPNIANGGFEGFFKAATGGFNGSIPAGWTPFVYSSGTVPANLQFADNTTNEDAGSHSVSITAATGREGGLYTRFSTTAGNTYTLSCRRLASGGQGFLGASWDGTTDNPDAAAWVDSGISGWQTLTLTGKATSNSVVVYLDAYNGGPIYFDSVALTPGPTGDAAAPSFAGSITPSTATSTTPTITISAQDAGVGLNIDSAAFRYSTDSGLTYSQWITPMVLRSKAIVGAGRYWYPDFYHPSYTIASGDHLVYDIWTNNSSGPSGSVDLEGSGWCLRDSGINDQNNLSAHPATDIHANAYHQWYHRDFNLSSKAGSSITAFEAAHDGSTASPSEFFVRNVQIVNGSTVKLDAFEPGFPQVSETVSPGNNNSVQMFLDLAANPGDLSTPITCSGFNGASSAQTISATTGTLGKNSNNRIQFRIADANGNLVTSSAFTITVTDPPPTITANPVSLVVSSGSNASFTVTASGTGMSYQWKKDGATISGATSTTYNIASASTGNAGSYTCVVTNTGGSVTSGAATLAVLTSDGSIASAKLLSNGASVQLGNKDLYLKWPAFGYIEEPKLFTGIRVQGAVTAAQGDRICLTGTLQKPTGAEPYIQVTTMTRSAAAAVSPMAANNKSLSLPIADGLYVVTFGRVKTGTKTANSYEITDGSGSTVKVITQGAPTVNEGDYVWLTGAAGTDAGRVVYQK